MRINYFFSKPDIYINPEKLYISNAIIVTGLSGSGKSYLTNKIVELTGFARCSFDNLLENDIMYNPTEAEKTMLNIFIKKYPKYKNVEERKKKVKDFFNDFLDFSLEYLEKHQLQMVLDCAGFINIDVIEFEKIQHLPIIVKQTSYVKSILRRLKRNYKYLNQTNLPKIKVNYWFLKEILYILKRTPVWIKRKKNFLNKLKQKNIIKCGKEVIFYVQEKR